jgi:hypothetical protein
MKITLTTKWLERLDSLTHWLNKKLGVPVVAPICDAYEKRLLESYPIHNITTTSAAAMTVKLTYPKNK